MATTCPTCNGNGRVEMLEHCPICKGKSEIDTTVQDIISDHITEIINTEISPSLSPPYQQITTSKSSRAEDSFPNVKNPLWYSPPIMVDANHYLIIHTVNHEQIICFIDYTATSVSISTTGFDNILTVEYADPKLFTKIFAMINHLTRQTQ